MKLLRFLSCLLFACLAVHAGDYRQQSGTAGAADYVTFPGYGLPRLLSLDLTGDAAGSALTIRKYGQPITITTNAASGDTTVYVALGHGLTNSDVAVLNAQGGAKRLVVDSATTNSVTFTAAIGFAATAGTDTLHESESTVVTTIGSGTVRLNGECLAIGRRNVPLGLELNGTSAAKINSAVVTYD